MGYLNDHQMQQALAQTQTLTSTPPDMIFLCYLQRHWVLGRLQARISSRAPRQGAKVGLRHIPSKRSRSSHSLQRSNSSPEDVLDTLSCLTKITRAVSTLRSFDQPRCTFEISNPHNFDQGIKRRVSLCRKGHPPLNLPTTR